MAKFYFQFKVGTLLLIQLMAGSLLKALSNQQATGQLSVPDHIVAIIY